MKYKFIVQGQPIPFTRTTTRAKFVSKQWKRYAEYKDKVVAAFLNTITDNAEKRTCAYNYSVHGKPINTGNNKVYVLSIAYFKNKIHGDPDNIQKCVKDSLFVSDKYVAGAYNYNYDNVNPRLEITICSKTQEWESVLGKIKW